MRIRLRQASLTYQAGTPFASQAVSDASLSVAPGERVGISGPVGSGKSTLLAMLAGMLPPTAGAVEHGGAPLGRKNPPVPGSIGFAFQSPENCLFEKTVYDDVAFAPRNLGAGEEEVAVRVSAALSAVGLDPDTFASRNPFSLSLGEQRRVALAGLFAMQPPVMLLDEPTAHLDPLSRHDIIERLVKLNEDTGASIVMVGHDMDEMARFAQRLIVMDGGAIVADGIAHHLLADSEMMKRHKLRTPGTVELCHILARESGREITPVFSEAEALELLIAAARRDGS